MRILTSVLFILTSGLTITALADNPLTTEQLVKAVQASLKDYATVEPDMSRSISGFRTSTSGKRAQIIIDMNSDGMKMSARYVCASQGAEMVCNQQQ